MQEDDDGDLFEPDETKSSRENIVKLSKNPEEDDIDVVDVGDAADISLSDSLTESQSASASKAAGKIKKRGSAKVLVVKMAMRWWHGDVGSGIDLMVIFHPG